MKNITRQQEDLLARLRAVDPTVEVRWDEARGVAGSIRGKLGFGGRGEAESKVKAFLDEYGLLAGPPDLQAGLRLLRRKGDDLGWEHLTFCHTVRDGIEVYGAKFVAHFDAEGALVEVQSGLWRDLDVRGEPKVAPDALRRILLKRIEGVKGFEAVRRRVEQQEKDFPMTDPPRLVVYPWKGKFRLAWTAYGYGDLDEREGKPVDAPYITFGQFFVDAITGKRILFAPTLMTAETPTTGTGLAVTPLTGTHTSRTLNIVRVDSGSTYRLKDTTHNRDIVTFDAACDTAYNSDSEIGTALKNGTLPVSNDTDGDHNWSRLPSDTTDAQRTAGQQPEVDAHHFVRQQYEWYDAISGGRDGWDAGNYPNPPVPNQVVNVLAHCRGPDDWGGGFKINNSYCWSYKSSGTWVCWLAFMEGDMVAYDYMAGSHFIVAHEYQHAITDFSFEDTNHNPGFSMYSGWLGAVHEGLSDTFGVLSTGQWRPGTDISPASPPLIFRNLVYPRDTAAYDNNKLDHFADRNAAGAGFYERGTILAHCAYLIGNGGVHQRAARTPQLIPVYALGSQTIGGKSLLKAARIWYRALAHYFSTHGVLTGIPTNDENTFRTLRDGCVNAAIDLYGAGSVEHRTTILAFYAVGLHPTDQTYGADVTFLRWGVAWDLSRNYVGLTCPDYASLDLFVNNGGTSEWNALINVNDPATGQPTKYENNVYCRVRNVGDQDALNVEVEFDYAKAGTAPSTWLPVTDKDGNIQKLTIANLPAGQSNFADSAQHSPPASAGIKWCIPPLAAGETVDHFCLRAKVKASNDVNTHNNDVQSNIAYTAYAPPAPATATFIAGNPFREKTIPLDVRLDAKLPEGWKVSLRGIKRGEQLKPGEERRFTVSIKPPARIPAELEPPFNGDLRGLMTGDAKGEFAGSLTETMLKGRSLVGQFSALLPKVGTVCGRFKGNVNLKTGSVKGYVVGPHSKAGRKPIRVEIKAGLRPWRRVDISQWVDEHIVGGVTVQLQVPWNKGPFAYDLPPTDTHVNVRRR